MKIALSHIKKDLVLEMKGEDNTLFEISNEDVMRYGEAKIQLKEGCSYEYQFSDETIKFKEESKKNAIISYSKFGKHKGSINPNIYVGTHSLEIDNTSILLPIEVRSVKSEYRSDYRYMLESITEKCTDLIMQIDSPITQHFETDFNKNPETLYQRFSFVKSLIDSLEFEEAIQKIVSNPTTKWEEEREEKDIRSIRRFNQKNIKQLVTKSNRMELNSEYYNVRYGEKYELSTNEIGAQYLLLYSKDQTESTLFFKLKNNGTKVYTKAELKNDLKYKTTPSQEMYLVYKIEAECEKEFSGLNIDLTKLDGLGANKRPIAISIEQLMKSKIK